LIQVSTKLYIRTNKS